MYRIMSILAIVTVLIFNSSCVSYRPIVPTSKIEMCTVHDSIAKIFLTGRAKYYERGVLVKTVTAITASTGSHIGNKMFITVNHGLSNMKTALAGAIKKTTKHLQKTINKKDLTYKLEYAYLAIIPNRSIFKLIVYKQDKVKDLMLFRTTENVNSCPITIARRKVERYVTVKGYGHAKGTSLGGYPHAFQGMYIGADTMNVKGKYMPVDGYTIRVFSGMSGGPILYKGQIVGIIQAKDRRLASVSYAASLENIKNFLKPLLKK